MPSQRTTPWQNIEPQTDSSTGSTKIFTVSTGEQWVVHSIYAELTASSVAGNRIPTVNILDTSSNTYLRYDGPTVSSGLSRNITWSPGVPNDTGYVNGAALRNLGYPLVVPSEYRVQYVDSTVVSTLDNSTVRLLIERRYI